MDLKDKRALITGGTSGMGIVTGANVLAGRAAGAKAACLLSRKGGGTCSLTHRATAALSERYCREFTHDVLAHLPEPEFVLRRNEILAWIAERPGQATA